MSASHPEDFSPDLTVRLRSVCCVCPMSSPGPVTLWIALFFEGISVPLPYPSSSLGCLCHAWGSQGAKIWGEVSWPPGGHGLLPSVKCFRAQIGPTPGSPDSQFPPTSPAPHSQQIPNTPPPNGPLLLCPWLGEQYPTHLAAARSPGDSQDTSLPNPHGSCASTS